jgi:hypothetical protein
MDGLLMTMTSGAKAHRLNYAQRGPEGPLFHVLPPWKAALHTEEPFNTEELIFNISTSVFGCDWFI